MAEIKCPNCGEVFQVSETSYSEILNQVRNDEFEKELKQRISEIEVGNKKSLELELAKSEASKEKELAKKDLEIANLQQKIALAESEKIIAVSDAIAEKNKELADKEKVLGEKQNTITLLQGNLDSVKTAAELREKELSNDYSEKLRFKDEEIARYKDFKLKLSTKMVGESLEKYCEDEFNKIRSIGGFQGSYFEKDNDIVDGTKGDFIFRDYDDDGNEYVSILIECKNEMEDTEKKHKNESFFKKLHEDRIKKGCEYALLVSTLEEDSEYYQGITDVSHKFPKMFVVRPAFMLSLIGLLKTAAQGRINLQRELAFAKSQSIDITHFEERMNEFKDKFGTQYKYASQKFESAISDIDKSIKMLQKIREELVSSENHLRLANERAEDLTIKKLTRGNPTMQKAFAALESSGKEQSV